MADTIFMTNRHYNDDNGIHKGESDTINNAIQAFGGEFTLSKFRVPVVLPYLSFTFFHKAFKIRAFQIQIHVIFCL